MWLINATTLKLEYFIGPEAAPSYAILSHTWDDGEVTFQEFQDVDSAKLKPGFAKIQKTCDLARDQDGLQYAWVDTCCIDKSSSAELSESINSMYDWYRGSTICYAYLNDWASESDGDWAKLGELDFRLSKPELLRWFTRGWTLQELIAPAKITFYDESWVARGTKSDSKIICELSRITKINSRILEDGSEENLRRTSLGQRMS